MVNNGFSFQFAMLMNLFKDIKPPVPGCAVPSYPVNSIGK